jgi:hypothetical protein
MAQQPELPHYQNQDCSTIGATGVMMGSSQASPDASGPVQPLKVSVEILSTLIYLARRTEMHSERDGYLDWAAKVMEELQHHPNLRDWTTATVAVQPGEREAMVHA